MQFRRIRGCRRASLRMHHPRDVKHVFYLLPGIWYILYLVDITWYDNCNKEKPRRLSFGLQDRFLRQIDTRPASSREKTCSLSPFSPNPALPARVHTPFHVTMLALLLS